MLLLSLLALGLPLVEASSSLDPCADITKQIKNHEKSNSSLLLTFPAQKAEDCLQSMPFYPKAATKFINELTKYVQWQSTLEALKNPPKTYMSLATDILGSLEKIRETKYSSQWEFDQAINAVFVSANDGHFYVSSCSFGIFTFLRGEQAIVSVSKDGIKAPELYTFLDSKLINDTNAKISPIVSIDGQDAESFLEKVASTKSYQDPNARYNEMFFSSSRTSDDEAGGFFASTVYPGKNVTTLMFRNGTTTLVPNLATVKANDFDAKDGKDVYELYCRPELVSNSTSTATNSSNESTTPRTPLKRRTKPSTLKPRSTSGPQGYPRPIIHDPFHQINSYYLGDDTVVMLIPSFDTDVDAGMPEDYSFTFSNYASKIVEKALEDGRDKIIIDLSNNGGGNISRGFDLFKLFFPNKFPYSATRFRRHEVSERLVQIISVANESFTYDHNDLSFSRQVTPDQEGSFKSYRDFLGNKTELGVPITSLHANFNYTYMSGPEDGAPIRGYAGRPLPKKQPFKAENILIIGDGTCTSTCTTFVNLMTNIGDVRTLSFGGQPNRKPMQIMGGVRGVMALKFEDIFDHVRSTALLYNDVSQKLDFISKSDIDRLIKIAPKSLGLFPIRITDGGVNFRNAYQEGDDDLPLQFQYQAADCRLYYTVENVFQPETMWKSAKQAIWGNGTCVKGSTGGLGSLEDRKKKSKDKGKENEDKDDEEKGEKESGESFEKPPDSGAHSLTVGWSLLGMVFTAMMVSF